MGFEAPLALLGLLAASLPILAHLVRRRDLPVVELPTIALLERAQAQSRRRMRLVDLLLLIARILLIAAIALAVADPYLTVRLAYGDGRLASVAIVVDDSMSMARGAGGPLAEDAVERAADAIEALPSGSEVAVILAGSPARLLLPRTDDLDAAVESLGRVRHRTARGTAMPEAVAMAARELHGARHEARRMLVLSDVAQHAGWQDVTWPESAVAIDVERIGDEAPTPNRAVTSAVAVPDPTAPDTSSVSVEVRSHAAPEGSVHVALRRGGEVLERAEVQLVEGVGRATLHGPLVTEGDPTAEVVIEAEDALDVDDRRAVLLRPPSSLRVLLVDGDPHASRDRAEVGFAARALDMAPATEGAITYRTVDPDTLASQDLSGFDVVVLANSPAPPSHVAQRLIDFVEGGGGLLITAGGNFDSRAYLARLGELLPAHPRADAVLQSPLGLRRTEQSELLSGTESGLQNVQTRRRLLLEPPVGDGRVELAFDDGAPALAMATRGSGRTALLATTLDDDWTDLPYRPGFLPLVTRLTRALSPRADLPDRPVEPGATVSLPVPPGATRLVVVDPTGAEHDLGADEPVEFTDTEVAGAYRVLVATRASALEDDPRSAFMVAPPPNESDLSPGELPRLGGSEDESASSGAVVKRSMAPWLFVLAGLFALAEAILRLHGPGRRLRRAAA